MDCPLCRADGEKILWQDDRLRVIAVDDEAHAPAFCRVIWRAHVAEMSDLPATERDALMRVVYALESAMRTVLQPCKINLASLGNVVPHLHWHVIARFENDACFPAPIWAAAKRTAVLELPCAWQDKVKDLLVQML